MYVNKRDQLAAERVIALKKNNVFLFKFACIRTSLDWYFFVFSTECLYQFSDIFWLIVWLYTSLGRVCFTLLFFWISVVVIGYFITHRMCLCPSLDPCLFLYYSVSAYSSVRLYCHWFQFYRYFSWSAYLSSKFFFFFILLCVRVYYR